MVHETYRVKDEILLKHRLSLLIKKAELHALTQKAGSELFIDVHTEARKLLDEYMQSYPMDDRCEDRIPAMKELYELAYPPPISKAVWYWFTIACKITMGLFITGGICAFLRLGYIFVLRMFHIH